jgi:hypothetical protein
MDRLERQNRRQRWLLLALPFLALVLGAQAADWKGKSIITEKLVLVDADGKERGSFATGKSGSYLNLHDGKGKLRIQAIADHESKGPAFFLLNEKGTTIAVIRMIDNGPILTLCNEDGKHLVAIGKSTGNGVGFIEFYDDKGNLIGGYGGTGFNK